MTINDQIDFDVACLKGYFQHLFSLAESASKITPVPSANNADTDRFVAHSIASFIRPDMACNIYSLLDFWLARLCLFHERNNHLTLNYKDIKGKTQLHAYHKYLTKIALIDLQAVLPNFDNLDSLRKVRNHLVHGGAHVEEQQSREIANIPGVSVQGSLIVLSDSFIWESLEHARMYLCAVAQAYQLIEPDAAAG